MNDFFKALIKALSEITEEVRKAVFGDKIYDKIYGSQKNKVETDVTDQIRKIKIRQGINGLIIFFVLFIAFGIFMNRCKVKKGKEGIKIEKDTTIKNQSNKPQWSGSAIPELVVARNNLKIFYIENKHLLYLEYFDGKAKHTQTIDTISGWSGIAPYVILDSLDNNKVSIVLEIFTPAPSFASSDVYVYIFDTHNQQVKQLCYFESVGTYERENEDKFPEDIEFYDYFIDRSKKEIIVKEYKPYKSNSEKNKYTTVVEKRCGY